MSSFDAWLDSRPAGDAEVRDLLQARSAVGAGWPTGGDGWAAYAAAIAQSTGVADKAQALAGLERAYRSYAPGSTRPSFWATLASWVSNVYFWAVLLGGGVIFFLFSFALDKSMLVELAEPTKARGLITFLFAVATVGIALVIVLAVFLSTGAKEEVSERFQMGKDILAVLIGVFGTIIGFYFGSEKSTPTTAPPPAAIGNAPVGTGN